MQLGAGVVLCDAPDALCTYPQSVRAPTPGSEISSAICHPLSFPPLLDRIPTKFAIMDPKAEVIDMDTDADLAEATAFGTRLIETILNRAPFEVVKAQVDAGAPLWFQDDEGTSALHAAAYVENLELVRYLIEEGAVWNAGTSCCISSVVHRELTICFARRSRQSAQ